LAKVLQPKLMYRVYIGDLVPENHFYRQLKDVLDLGFLYKLVEPLYGDCGQESIDPVVFFKLLLFSYLEDITSDRELVMRASDSLAVRFFLNYDIDEPLPWHSTISRTRRLLPAEVFTSVFESILSMCVEAGLVAGNHQSIDSTLVKANASIDHIEKRRPQLELKAHIEKTYRENPVEDRAIQEKGGPGDRQKPQLELLEAGPKGKKPLKGKSLSNREYFSPTDPDSRIAKKPGKIRDLYYLAGMAVDASFNVITTMDAYHADQKDSQTLIPLVDQIQDRLKGFGLKMESLAADAGYSSGENYKELEERAIEAFIPPHGRFIPERKGFSYDPQKDHYICSQGKILHYSSTDERHNLKRYLAKRSDCSHCPSKERCFGKGYQKKIEHTLYLEYYKRMQQRLMTRRAKKMARLRKIGPEPVFGTLIQHHSLSRVNARGINLAQKIFLLIASAYNLKKFLKYGLKKANSVRNRIGIPLSPSLSNLISFCQRAKNQLACLLTNFQATRLPAFSF